MPRRHSQNNTAGAIFTHYEKTQLKEYGTQRQRLNRDNMKPFDACTLCLKPVQTPIADREGSIYCKQCIYMYLLDQKKQYKKLLKEYKKQKEEEKVELQEKEKKVESSKIEAFVEREKGFSNDTAGKKHKERINNFWLPSSTPSHVKTKLKKPSSVTLSPSGHPMKLKELVPLSLTPIPSEKDESKTDFSTGKYMCPTCSKSLNNVTGVVCIMKSSQVFCQHCMDTVIKKDMVCPITNEKFEEKDLLKLESEGSSFACRSGTALEAVKETPAPRL